MQLTSSRLAAILAYIPVIGWLYVLLLQRQNPLAIYHLRQSIGLCLFLIASFSAWVIVAWLLAWIPDMAVISIALFTVVMIACFYGMAVWVTGMVNAFKSRMVPLPLFGRWADRLPIR